MLHNKTNNNLRIKLIQSPEEKELYSDLITRRHYLGSSCLNSNTLMHVVSRGRETIAILTWEPKTRNRFALRDKLIGWSKEGKQKRIKHCIENRRFLMLVKEDNLASQVLSLSVSKLCEDGLKQYGYDLMLAETFTDPEHGKEGICYKAANWIDVGLTVGGKGPDKRSAKRYFVKELKKNALEKLKSPMLSLNDLKNPRQTDLLLDRIDFNSLKKYLDQVKDYRSRKGKNELTPMLMLIIAAILSGSTNIKEISRWVDYLSMEAIKRIGCRRAPSYATLRRVLINVDHADLTKHLCSWLTKQTAKLPLNGRVKILTFDGKAIKSASKFDDNTDFHILNLIDSMANTLRNQMPVRKNKENEIPVAQQMLEEENIDADTIITGDAMHTQKKTAEIIVKKKPTIS